MTAEVGIRINTQLDNDLKTLNLDGLGADIRIDLSSYQSNSKDIPISSINVNDIQAGVIEAARKEPISLNGTITLDKSAIPPENLDNDKKLEFNELLYDSKC